MKHFFRFLFWMTLPLVGMVLLYQNAYAAKKYYPPGYSSVPSLSPTENQDLTPAKQLKAQAGVKIIIKKVPIKPKDSEKLTTLIENRRYYEALQLINQQIQKAPQDILLRLTKAKVLRGKRDFKAAYSEYQWVFNQSDNPLIKAEAFNGLGKTQYAQAIYLQQHGENAKFQSILQQAQLSYENALKLQPEFPEALAGLAEIELAQNHLKTAEAEIRKASQEDASNNYHLLLVKGLLALKQQNPTDALPILYKAKHLAPFDPEVYLLLAQAYFALGQDDNAIIQIQSVLEQIPDQTEALQLLAKVYLHKTQFQLAQETLQKAIAFNPADQDSVMTLLKLEDTQQKYAQEMTLLKMVFARAPQQTLYEEKLASKLYQLGKTDEAFRYSTDAINTILSNTGKLKDTVSTTFLETFTQIAHTQGEKSIEQASFLKQPAISKMIAYYHQQIQANPMNLNNRLEILLLDPRLSLPPLPPSYTPTMEQLPIALQIAFLQGNWDLHQTLLQTMLEKTVLPEAQIIKTINTLLVLGDVDAAQTLAHYAIELKPDSTEAERLFQSVLSQRTRREAVFQNFEDISERQPFSIWKDWAQKALQLNNCDSTLHGHLAELLMKEGDYESALIQGQFAAQYAHSSREKHHWQQMIHRIRFKQHAIETGKT